MTVSGCRDSVNFGRRARERQARFREESSLPVFPVGRRHGHLLASGNEDENLYPTLRGDNGARRFFEVRSIRWWQDARNGDDSSGFACWPTGWFAIVSSAYRRRRCSSSCRRGTGSTGNGSLRLGSRRRSRTEPYRTSSARRSSIPTAPMRRFPSRPSPARCASTAQRRRQRGVRITGIVTAGDAETLSRWYSRFTACNDGGCSAWACLW